MRKRWLGFVVAVVALAIGVWAWPRLPAGVATHWDIHGTPDGYSSRLFAVLITPVILVVINGVFRILPRLDPRRANYEKFQDTYWLIANAVALFLLGIHVLVMINGLGRPVAMSRLMPVAVGLLFVVLGNSLSRVPPTWFVRIRTPWTLSSDTVWRKTHRTGGVPVVIARVVRLTAAVVSGPRGWVLPAPGAGLAGAGAAVQAYIPWRGGAPEEARAGGGC